MKNIFQKNLVSKIMKKRKKKTKIKINKKAKKLVKKNIKSKHLNNKEKEDIQKRKGNYSSEEKIEIKKIKKQATEKQIEKFRIREVKELEKLERVSLREQREDYAGLQERIEKLKEKYRIIRDQKIRERVEALGIQIQGDEDRETLLLKEKEYTIARQKIEFCLESFYRSANSLVFQLNKRHITRNMSILRCIDRRFETGEIFIKWDDAIEADWLILIYIKNNSPDEGIIIEDKTNHENHTTHEFQPNEIFKASDIMVDALTKLLDNERNKRKVS